MPYVFALASLVTDFEMIGSVCTVQMGRVARQPFTFSDGTFIPQGTHLRVAVQATHLDDAYYTDPSAFDPFRFANKMDQQNKTRKLDMVTTHANFVAFGHGRHACPGRFFAAEMLKLTLAHIIMNYDVKLEGDHPKNIWIVATCIPSPTGEVMFRRRKPED